MDDKRLRTVLAVLACAATGAALGAVSSTGCIVQDQRIRLPPGQACRGADIQSDALNRRAAGCYLIALVNRDREEQRLAPLIPDEVAALAGQQQADLSVEHGYGGHWDIHGRKPDQRYTEAGGRDAVAENVHFSWVEQKRCPVDDDPRFKLSELQQIEKDWMHSESHRANILALDHTHIGVGLSRAAHVCEGARIAASLEFINHYGTYGDLPLRIAGAQNVELAGHLDDGVTFVELQLAHEGLPRRLTAHEAHGRGGYSVPEAEVRMRPGDDVHVDGVVFRASLGLGYAGPGVYYVRLWGQVPRGDVALVSQRTVVVAP